MSVLNQLPEFTLSTRPAANSAPGLIIRRVDTDQGWVERSNGFEWQPFVEADIDSNDEFTSLMVRNQAVDGGGGGGAIYGNIDGGQAATVYGGTIPINGGGA